LLREVMLVDAAEPPLPESPLEVEEEK
jgi:hypothetical protein